MITLNVIYESNNNGALDYVKEVKETGLLDLIHQEEGNIQYEYFSSLENLNKVFLLEKWESKEAVEKHNTSNNMKKLGEIKQKYNIQTTVNKFISD